MQFHLGRFIDRAHLRVADLEASKRFCGAVVASLRPGSLVEGKASAIHGEAERSAASVVVTPTEK